MNYDKIFAPPDGTSRQPGPGQTTVTDGLLDSVYLYEPKTILAVNVALASGRPLLVRGAPGSGKSSLALNVARLLKRRYYQEVITSRTQARDLLWRFDALRRLNDAQAGQLKKQLYPGRDTRYVEPGVLWWAIDRATALRRGCPVDLEFDPKFRPSEQPQLHDCPEGVVLIDEIDKAEPDLANDLLVPLSDYRFTVSETGTAVSLEARPRPLLVITTNEERELPAAFLRRCIILSLQAPDPARLEAIGRAHFAGADKALLKHIAAKLRQFQLEARTLGLRAPGTAEYLDAVGACRKLNISPPAPGEKFGSPEWELVAQIALKKHPEKEPDLDADEEQE